MKLPDFLIIGAMKAGTSSMHLYLGHHPDISMSRPKEIDFFARYYHRGLDWYMGHFSGGVNGESSNSNLKAHRWPEAAARIRRHIPEARLVCVLRNPVDRTLSHYLHNWRVGRETRPFAEAAGPEGEIFHTSRYGWQLDHYLAHFPREQLLLATTEELDRDPESVLRRIFRFVGVDDSVPIDTSRRFNVTAVKLAKTGLTVPDDPDLVVAGDEASLAPQARERLAARLRPDVERLRAVWPEFPGWQL